MNKSLLQSSGMDWCTPRDLFEELNNEFHFALDAAATEETKKCALCYTPETDGLSQGWDRGGAVFCNPPYGRGLGKWVEKASKEAEKGVTVVMLIPARTDTTYYHEYIYQKPNVEVRFIRGRLKFTNPDGSAAGRAPFPSMLAIFRGKGGKR